MSTYKAAYDEAPFIVPHVVNTPREHKYSEPIQLGNTNSFQRFRAQRSSQQSQDHSRSCRHGRIYPYRYSQRHEHNHKRQQPRGRNGHNRNQINAYQRGNTSPYSSRLGMPNASIANSVSNTTAGQSATPKTITLVRRSAALDQPMPSTEPIVLAGQITPRRQQLVPFSHFTHVHQAPEPAALPQLEVPMPEYVSISPRDPRIRDLFFDCSVCKEPVVRGKRVCLARCRHEFCDDCILTWFETSLDLSDKKAPGCPICRKPMCELPHFGSDYRNLILSHITGQTFRLPQPT